MGKIKSITEDHQTALQYYNNALVILGEPKVPRAEFSKIYYNICYTYNKLKCYEDTLNTGLKGLEIESYLKKHAKALYDQYQETFMQINGEIAYSCKMIEQYNASITYYKRALEKFDAHDEAYKKKYIMENMDYKENLG